MAAKLDHLVILVSSYDESLPWYGALLPLLGFEKTRDHVWVNGQGIGFDVRLAEEDARPYERFGAGLNHIGLEVETVEALEAVRAAMAEAGFPVPEIQPFGEDRACFFKDPDGLRVEVGWTAAP
ncbi:VOC family protein [Parasphingopyxis marina]|uniref:VOC family protein n=1 Tax=Parasphingopyxis marina TaxID=2761622 RepID=A0A842I004_9SPHN|nr:VOC family protein [Parasphingopyxis marina]MBC2778013.1 VOC family protein [Parasphingopyxis marina]